MLNPNLGKALIIKGRSQINGQIDVPIHMRNNNLVQCTHSLDPMPQKKSSFFFSGHDH